MVGDINALDYEIPAFAGMTGVSFDSSRGPTYRLGGGKDDNIAGMTFELETGSRGQAAG